MNCCRHALRLALLLSLLVASAPPPARVAARPAATITVNFTAADLPDLTPNDGVCDAVPAIGGNQCTLRAAIQTANGLAGTDTIIVPSGTYTLTLTGSDDSAAMGDLDITQSVTIQPADAGSVVIVGGAGWDDRILHVTAGTVTLTRVTVRGGNIPGGTGGGIYNGGTLVLNGSTVSGNSGGGTGGGIYNGGTLVLNGSTVSGNSGGGNGGGGVFSSALSTLALNDSTVSGNTTGGGSRDGGGILSYSNNPLILNGSTISGNSAGRDGGGIYTNNTLTVNNSTISGNSAGGDGGGIYSLGGSALLNNVTISNNTADSDAGNDGIGGGVYIEAGTFSVQNSLIAGNSDNSPGVKHPDCSGTLASGGYNLIGATAGCTVAGTTTGNLLNVDARLAPLRGAGGTALHALLPGSPAIDAGSPAAPGSGGGACLAADQRGVARPRDGDADGVARCDMGAFELRTLVVDSPNDVVDASLGNGVCATSANECTLRAAIQETNALPGMDHVVVPFGTYNLALNPSGPNDAASGDLNVTSDLALIGAGADTTIIQGVSNWLDRIFRIEGVYAQISGVTVRGGGRNFSTGVECASASGGGICSTGTLTLIDSIVRDNRGMSNGGGGIYSVGVLALTNTTAISNTSNNYGGGIYSDGTLTVASSSILSNTSSSFGGGIYSEGTLVVHSSTIASNTVPSASGGGIVAWTGTATIIDSQIFSNTVSSWGGGLVSIAADVTLSRTSVLSNSANTGGGLFSQTDMTIGDSTISNNHAEDAGGGISVTGGTLTLDRSTLSGNTVAESTFGGGGIMSGADEFVATNSTISGNSASNHGGGLYLQDGTASLENVTIANNQADSDADDGGDGGGVWVNAANGAVLNFKNTLIAANEDLSPTIMHPDCYGPLASQGYNLVGARDAAACTFTALTGDQVGTLQAPLDPRLNPLANNGGGTLTHALQLGSPAINAADPADCLPSDQRGAPRPQLGGCDIGAFEFGWIVWLYLPLVVR